MLHVIPVTTLNTESCNRPEHLCSSGNRFRFIQELWSHVRGDSQL